VILGAGVIGRATALLLAGVGFEVFAEDLDARALNGFPATAGELPAEVDLICICVPTPATEAGMSLAAVAAALERARTIAAGSAKESLVAIRSTLMPGMFRVLTSRAGSDLAICYWPCFARERSAETDELSPRLVAFGADDFGAVQEVFARWLGSLECPVFLLNPEESELAKAGANAFNALKISYFNALGDWAQERGGSPAVVAAAVAAAAEGVWNPEYGTRPGPAFGGACLPKDLDAIIAALTADQSPHLELLFAARAINRSELRRDSRQGDA
jgi:UDPglucose 6-dehydrogenase